MTEGNFNIFFKQYIYNMNFKMCTIMYLKYYKCFYFTLRIKKNLIKYFALLLRNV